MLITLALIFGELSLLAFGGGNTVLPEMQRQMVEVHHWMSASEFSAMFALAQAAPGPNLMIVPMIGWRLAGLPGVLVTSLAKFAPSSVLTYYLVGIWNRFKEKRWRQVVQAGLMPMTTGLVAASATIMTIASDHHWFAWVITGVCAALAICTRIHPLWVLLIGAAAGFIGIGM